MKDEYDFSKGVRGKFYRPGAKLTLPVYLDQEVQSYLAQRASERGVELLRKDIELIEAGK